MSAAMPIKDYSVEIYGIHAVTDNKTQFNLMFDVSKYFPRGTRLSTLPITNNLSSVICLVHPNAPSVVYISKERQALWLEKEHHIYPTITTLSMKQDLFQPKVQLPLCLNDLPTIFTEIKKKNYKFYNIIPKESNTMLYQYDVVAVADIMDSEHIIGVGHCTSEAKSIDGLPGLMKIEVELVHIKGDFIEIIEKMTAEDLQTISKTKLLMKHHVLKRQSDKSIKVGISEARISSFDHNENKTTKDESSNIGKTSTGKTFTFAKDEGKLEQQSITATSSGLSTPNIEPTQSPSPIPVPSFTFVSPSNSFKAKEVSVDRASTSSPTPTLKSETEFPTTKDEFTPSKPVPPFQFGPTPTSSNDSTTTANREGSISSKDIESNDNKSKSESPFGSLPDPTNKKVTKVSPSLFDFNSEPTPPKSGFNLVDSKIEVASFPFSSKKSGSDTGSPNDKPNPFGIFNLKEKPTTGPPFSFSAPDNKESKTLKTKPSFTFDSPIPKDANTSTNTTPKSLNTIKPFSFSSSSEKPTSLGFKFGSSSKDTPNKPKPAFSFGSSRSDNTSNEKTAGATSFFSFKKNEKTSSTTNSPTPAFSFADPPSSHGSSNSTPKPAEARPAFSFGSPSKKVDDSLISSSVVIVGSSTDATVNKPAFTFGPPIKKIESRDDDDAISIKSKKRGGGEI